MNSNSLFPIFMGITGKRDSKIPKDKIKHDEWVQLTFVWNGNSDTLTCYQNGNKIGSTDGVQAERPEVRFTIMTIGRPNNAVNTQFMMKMFASNIALWDKPLSEKEITKVFKLSKYFVGLVKQVLII